MLEITLVALNTSCLDVVRRGAGFLDHVDLGPGNGAGGHKGAVLGPDEGQVALGAVGAILGSLEFPLEAAHSGD